MDLVIENPKLNFGKIIYHYRIQLNVTQSEICKGICSITYLSKLENDKLDSPNMEIIELLLQQLNVDLEEYQNEVKDLEKEIVDWYKSIKIKDINQASNKYLKLQTYFTSKKVIHYIELKYWYDIILIRYLILLKDIDTCNLKIKEVKNIQKNLSNNQSFYYEYFLGIAKCIEKNYVAGLMVLKKAETKQIRYKIQDVEIYYHLALTYSHLNNVTLAIFYGDLALEYFNKNVLYLNSIECQLILGINYSRVNKFLKAKEYYENVLAIALSQNLKDLLGKVLNNLGCMYSQAANRKEAIRLYLESLKFKKPYSEDYSNTVYGIIQECLLDDDPKKALYWIKEGFSTLSDLDKTNKIRFSIKKFEIEKNPYLYTFLENEAIPLYEEKQDYLKLCNVYEKLAEYYSMIFQYKKSSLYYSISINYRKKLIKLGENDIDFSK